MEVRNDRDYFLVIFFLKKKILEWGFLMYFDVLFVDFVLYFVKIGNFILEIEVVKIIKIV